MQDSFRRSHLTLVLFGPLAVAASVATYKVGKSSVLTGAQLSLPTSGSGGGNTSVIVKVNGVAVTPALSVASAAAGVTASSPATAPAPAPGVYPQGVGLKPGDIVTVDVTAITANPPAGGSVILDLTQRDA
jgi:hypothetical protein